MLRKIPPLLLSSIWLLIVAPSYAQNACPSQASFDSSGTPIDASFTDVEVGDVNQDTPVSHLDALWLDPTNGVIIIDFGDGQGSFPNTETHQIPNTGSVAVGDIDGDGDNDLVTFDPNNGVVRLSKTVDGVINSEFENLTEVVNNPSERAFSLLDINEDGDLDIVSTQAGAPDCVVVRLGPTFLPPTGCLIDDSAGKLVAVDLNNDNVSEFIQSESAKLYSKSGMTFTVERNLAEEGSFTSVGVVNPRDVDGDGDVDIQISGEDANGPLVVNFINHFITQCNDGIDNDNDGPVDLSDFGCSGADDVDETNPSQATECSDGIDNDGDSDIDLADTACVIPGNVKENAESCGGESNIVNVQAGTFNMSTVGEVNDFTPSCGAGGLQPNAADKLVSFTLTQRSKVTVNAAGVGGYDAYVFVLSAGGCNSGEALACDKSLSNGATEVEVDDLAPGTYFIGVSSSAILGTDEGEASVTLDINVINPTTLVSSGALCNNAISSTSELLAFGDFNGDGEPDALSLAGGERLSMIQEICGNGDARLGEACDDGNQSNNDECLNNCELNICGDGFLNENAEECDDGNNINDDECNNNCQLPVCGNGTVEFGEECDDENIDPNDSCTDLCQNAVCGDKVIRNDLDEGEQGYEGCDDGNDVDGDGCFQCQISTEFEFVSFDGGSFLIGELSPTPTSNPDKLIDLGIFVMSRAEVTVAQYKLCVDDGICFSPRTAAGCNYGNPDKANHPINCISFNQATAYAAWLDTQILDIDIRLPSEAEWEFAARSGGQANKLAWGQREEPVCELGNIGDCNIGSTTAVCTYSNTFGTDPDAPNGDTAQGLCDITGNVSEWVGDRWASNYNSIPSDGTPSPNGTYLYRIHRGGTYTIPQILQNTSVRTPLLFRYVRPFIGFRVAGSPRCGNNIVDGVFGETCDDGNQTDGDGCSATCQNECGNSILNTAGPNYIEECDDGNFDAGDGCSDSCQIEAGYECDNDPLPSNCFIDSDLDGIIDAIDNCDAIPNPNQDDGDLDGVGDVCDNCVNIINVSQDDADSDGVGDACDNCVDIANDTQDNADGDNFGDLCDNCINDPNNDQLNDDGDDLGNVCDTCPGNDNTNSDDDSLCDALDNCDLVDNETQDDGDADGVGDLCDTCIEDPDNDADEDGVCVTSDPTTTDNCPNTVNPNQLDDDNDGVGDLCDVCVSNTGHDHDGDGICSAANPPDNCPLDSNPLQENLDNDAFGNICDDDRDGDGFPNDDEVACNRNPDNATDQIIDNDNDNVCDNNDLCQGDNSTLDIDNDGDCGDVDLDDDNDGWNDDDEVTCGTLPDSAASTPFDTDNDNVCDAVDACNGDDLSGNNDGDADCDDIDPDDDNDNVNSVNDGGDDCDDTDANIGSIALDQDCDGLTDDVDPDVDGDGVNSVNNGGDDCDDLDPNQGSQALNTDCDAETNDIDEDDDNDGRNDDVDPDDTDASICGDNDGDTCDDCLAAQSDDYTPGPNFTQHANFGVNGNFINDGNDADGDGLCDAGDFDGDNDGFNDDFEVGCGTNENDPTSFPVDTDGDDLCDLAPNVVATSNFQDVDNDNDGISNDEEDNRGSDPLVPNNCGDIDNDGCDDCSQAAANDFDAGDNFTLDGGTGRVTDDGADTDSDGLCDVTDFDNDNDTFDDNYEVSCNTDPADPNSFPIDTNNDGECNHVDDDDDGDGFTDAAEADCGTDSLDDTSKPTDTDSDGLCDLAPGQTAQNALQDDDNDNDGVSNTEEATRASDPLLPNDCGDFDGDGCNDCVLTAVDDFTAGPNFTVFNGKVTNDGPDLDQDGLCNDGDDDRDGDSWSNADEDLCVGGDPDDFNINPPDSNGNGVCDSEDDDLDGDGVPNAQDDDPNVNTICEDSDGDGCDDCAFMQFTFPDLDGVDTDEDGLCDEGDPNDPTDGDPDDDNDGFDDVDEVTCGTLPLDDTSIPSDYDTDGLCDNGVDLDDDNDSVDDLDINNNPLDECPLGSLGWTSDVNTDHDGDGCKDDDPDGEDDDDDNDGVNDVDVNGNPLDLCAKGNADWTSDANTDFDGDGCEDGTAEEDDKDNDGVADGDDDCDEGDQGWTSDATTDHDDDGCQDAVEDDDDDNDGRVDNADDCDPDSNLASVIGWNSNDPLEDHDGDGCKDDDVEDDDDDNDGYTDDVDLCDPDDTGAPDLGADASEIGWVADNLNDRDDDGCLDATEDLDDDNDTLSDIEESNLGTNPVIADTDGDQTNDANDNCPLTENFLQEDQDSDDIGDHCDDSDNDTVFDVDDNCIDTPNQNQDNHNNDDEGDACETGDPTATSETFDTNEDTPISGNVLTNDQDGDGDTLTASLVTDVDALHGTLVLGADGNFTFTPTLDFVGAATFVYVANDGRVNTSDTTVTINVNAVNDAPVAVGDSFNVDEDVTFDSLTSLPGPFELIANDSDIEGSALTVVIVDDPTNGTLTMTGNDFTYLSNLHYNGPDSFTYKVNDGDLDSNIVTVNITVDAVNDAPHRRGASTRFIRNLPPLLAHLQPH